MSGVQTARDRVLVVDDAANLRDLLSIVLEVEDDFEVVGTAADGRQAIEATHALHPDVILLDLLMPEMNGWQTMAALKAQPATKSIPIVIFSALPPAELAGHQGISGWLQKPLDQESLLRSLEQAAGQNRKVARVLIVEDDLDLARVLVDMFERHGIEVFHAGTGRAAIEISQRVEPDLLVLDLVLPEGDGFSVVNWLRRNDKLRLVPLVVYSAHDLTAQEKESLRLGHTEFLTKSRIGPTEFEEKVIGVLDEMFRQRGEGINHGA